MKIIKPVSKQPLPKSAKRVFKGKIFDVYQWKQKMFDGSYETFEKLKRPDTVIIFPVLNNGNIILTRQEQPGKKPFIGAAGGRVDKKESILDAAQRELLEETGYKADEFIIWKTLQPISKIEWSVYIFIARKLKKVSELNLDVGERIELINVNFDKFLIIASGNNFYEQEVYRDVVEALMDKNKKEKLRRFILGK